MNGAGVALLAEFRRHYADPSLYRSPHYKTSDGVIPFGAFWIYTREIAPQLAVDRVNMMRAVSNAISANFAKDARLPESVRADLKEARLQEE